MKALSMKTLNQYNRHKDPLYTDPLPLGDLNLSPLDMLEHVLATGGTGSGKTRSFLLPILEKTLQRFGDNEEQKAGMFLIDAKGDMANFATLCTIRSGREDDVFILGEGGTCWFPLFDQFEGDPTRIANFLMEILEDRTSKGAYSKGGSNDAFWQENARRLLRSSVILAKASYGFRMNGLEGIKQSLSQIIAMRGLDEDHFKFRNQIPKLYSGYQDGMITRKELDVIDNYIKYDVVGGDSRTWSTISNMTRNYLEQFSQPALLDIFNPDPIRREISPEAIIDEGLLLIVNLSPSIYGDAATPFRMAIKKAFCERILQRDHLSIRHGGQLRCINQVRPILFVCDEFHTTVTAGNGGESYFLDRAREFGCMCILATQGISAIKSALANDHLVDHLLNNLRTKFFFANDCPITSQYFESLGGFVERVVNGISFQPREAPPRFRLPNHEYSPHTSYAVAGKSAELRRLPNFCAAKLGKLPNGTAYVVSKGRVLHQYTHDPADYGIQNHKDHHMP
jgi:hypothetical protein